MPWLKLLHISAVIVWCGTLLYLPLAIASIAAPRGQSELVAPKLLRGLFTLVATPAALVAIASGTAIFTFQGPLAAWLIGKLVLVAMLVLGHAACGMLVLRCERGEGPAAGWSWLVVGSTLLWLSAIAWLVLRKPF
jgi:putative membrane protein